MKLSLPKRIVVASFIASLAPINIIGSSTSGSIEYHHHFIQEAHADSTGKFSTKLTARKRYYPRIVEGVKQFNALAEKGDANAFSEKDDIDKFKRAMSLYGASLRKGEVPDEISRQAEEKTLVFIAELEKLRGTNKLNGDQIKRCRTALDDYLSFAKLEPSSAQVYF